MGDVVLGILAVLIGLLFCFRGYLAMRLVIPVWGAFAGFMLGAGLVASFADEGFLASALGWLVGAGVAVLFALLAYLYYEVSVLLAMAAIGFAIGTSVMVALGVTWSWLIVLVGVLLAGGSPGVAHAFQRVFTARTPAEVVTNGATGSVSVELADGRTYAEKGNLNFAGSTVDGATGTVQMRGELPNPSGELLPGQYLRVRVIAGTEQAIVVPQTAVMQNETGRFVWLAGADGKAAPRNIRAAQWLGEGWVVREGLKAGDTVILDNLSRLRPGVPVQVKKAG
mgnify:CR=1 FL=1